MKIKASLLLAVRYLSAKGPSRAVSLRRIRGGIFGICLSLVPMVLVFQVANGMIEGISSRYIETGTYHVQAWPVSFNFNRPEELQEKLAQGQKKLEALDSAVFVGQELRMTVLGSSSSQSLGLSLRAVEPSLMNDPGFVNYIKLDEGSLDLSDPQTALIGREAARLLGLKTGDDLRILTTSTDGMGMAPRMSRFKIGGIVSCGYQELDKLWCFINIERGIRIMPASSRESFLALKIDQPYRLTNPLFANQETLAAAQASVDPDKPDLIESIRRSLGRGWRLYTWYELQEAQYLNFVTTRNLLIFIMVLMVVIASVNIWSTMIMMVLEKQQEIAILKSMGASPRAISLIFIIGGGVTGAAGALLGLFLGVIISLGVNEIITVMEFLANLFFNFVAILQGKADSFMSLQFFNPAFYLERIPITIHFGDLLLMFLLTVGLSTVVAFLPSRRAGRMRPLEIMRRI